MLISRVSGLRGEPSLLILIVLLVRLLESRVLANIMLIDRWIGRVAPLYLSIIHIDIKARSALLSMIITKV